MDWYCRRQLQKADEKRSLLSSSCVLFNPLVRRLHHHTPHFLAHPKSSSSFLQLAKFHARVLCDYYIVRLSLRFVWISFLLSRISYFKLNENFLILNIIFLYQTLFKLYENLQNKIITVVIFPLVYEPSFF